MVVTEREIREVAMEIENDISINIHKEVTLALLGIDEPMNLQHIIFHLFNLLDRPDPSCMTEYHLGSVNA